MELDLANLTQILSFESRVIKRLLSNIDETNKPKYPLFYQMQQNSHGELKFLNSIEIALEENQIHALNEIINHCVKY